MICAGLNIHLLERSNESLNNICHSVCCCFKNPFRKTPYCGANKKNMLYLTHIYVLKQRKTRLAWGNIRLKHGVGIAAAFKWTYFFFCNLFHENSVHLFRNQVLFISTCVTTRCKWIAKSGQQWYKSLAWTFHSFVYMNETKHHLGKWFYPVLHRGKLSQSSSYLTI